MVSNKFLGAVCVKLGFHKHLRYNGALLEYQIREYVTELTEAERDADGARDYWTIVKNPPKVHPSEPETPQSTNIRLTDSDPSAYPM